MTFSHCVTCHFRLRPIMYRDGVAKEKGFNNREDIIHVILIQNVKPNSDVTA